MVPTKPNQPVLVVSSRALGTSALAANGLNLYVCYQAPAGPLTTVGNGVLNVRLPAQTKLTFAMNGIIHPPAPGTYLVAMCGHTTSPNWNDNDYGSTSALVF
jgi:hypothetical protein